MENTKDLVMPDGAIISSLMDLYFWILNVDDSTLKILLNGDKNKLSKIVKDFFNMNDLAEDLEIAKTREDVLLILRKYIFRKKSYYIPSRFEVYKLIKENL